MLFRSSIQHYFLTTQIMHYRTFISISINDSGLLGFNLLARYNFKGKAADSAYLLSFSDAMDKFVEESSANLTSENIKLADDKITFNQIELVYFPVELEDGSMQLHEKNRKGGVSGFGLGLNYVDQVMQAHGGKVTVSSEKDKFSEFTLYIPKNV